MIDLSRFEKPRPTSSKSKIIFWTIASGFFFETWLPWPISLKVFLLKAFGASLGKNIVLKPRIKVKSPWLLSIGDCSWIGEAVWIENIDEVAIGSHVCLSQGVRLIDGNHDFNDPSFRTFSRKIQIDSGCWVGAHTIIFGGVQVPKAQFLKGGSVIRSSKDIEYNGN